MAPRHINYRLLRRRFRRTLAYGKSRKIDQLSAPLTDAARTYFDHTAPFDYLDQDFATNLSREACVDPCSLIVAFVYLERLRKSDRPFFETSNPDDLYLAALVLASKYLHDDTEAEHVFNDEWATSAGRPLAHVNALEIALLKRLDWNLNVTGVEFERTLDGVEQYVCGLEWTRRGFSTYSELDVLSRRCCQQTGRTLIAPVVLASLVGAVGVLGLALCASAAVHLVRSPPLSASTSPAAAPVDNNDWLLPSGWQSQLFDLVDASGLLLPMASTSGLADGVGGLLPLLRVPPAMPTLSPPFPVPDRSSFTTEQSDTLPPTSYDADDDFPNSWSKGLAKREKMPIFFGVAMWRNCTHPNQDIRP